MLGGQGKGGHSPVRMARHYDLGGIHGYAFAKRPVLGQSLDNITQKNVVLEGIVVGPGLVVVLGSATARGCHCSNIIELGESDFPPAREAPAARHGNGRINAAQRCHVHIIVDFGKAQPAGHCHLNGRAAPHAVDVHHHWQRFGGGIIGIFGNVNKDAAGFAHVLNGQKLKVLLDSQGRQGFRIETEILVLAEIGLCRNRAGYQ
mmetsp:Transcript_6375/g.15876  ORF Transcript_6375/g.15876 Transcript_6375/m.15876 type:complete len:204 (+) Transcript_6375:620-1231(+)